MLKLKLQYFGHLMWRTDSFEKTLMLGKIEGGRRRGWTGWDGWMSSPTQWTWVWASSWHCWWTGKPGTLQSMGLQRLKHNWVTESNWYWTDISSISLDTALIFPFTLKTTVRSHHGPLGHVWHKFYCVTLVLTWKSYSYLNIKKEQWYLWF